MTDAELRNHIAHALRRSGVGGLGRLKLLDALVPVVRAMLAERGWQPIASAPKDGTQLLLYGILVPTGNPYIDVGWWADYQGGFWDWSADDSQPTHWQPLPPPPTGGE